ncbi:hypothetical protein A8926_0187 [Saccharopolyspora spinosa]|uniref:Uncharacterized protein n=1 Tax=Saccharopolyspora spinosa TaxID=60894 RepID=A0A2N3XQ44_SACSN|nr:hypothetical protein A8926_0187 [Saccharopolyspora spinosa]
MFETGNSQRYFWLPVPDESSDYGLTRHAFAGTRLDSGTAGKAFCGNTFSLAQPSEMDWIHAKTATHCSKK